MPPSTSACPFPLYSRIHRVCSGLSLPWKNVPSNFPLIWNLRASRRMIGKFFKIIPSTKTFLFRSRIVKNPLKIPKYQRNHVPPFFFLHNTLPNNRNRSNENYSQTIYDNIHLYKKKRRRKENYKANITNTVPTVNFSHNFLPSNFSRARKQMIQSSPHLYMPMTKKK